MAILIGADPELFVKKDGEFHSAYGLVPGNKADPYRVKNGAVQIDGMALEINIDPAVSSAMFVHNISDVLATLRKMVPAEYEFEISSHAKFSAAHMKEQPEEALALGCDPDYNAYTEDVNSSPHIPMGVRTGGGHIHIGWTENADIFETSHFQSCCDFVKQLDYYLGIPFMLLEYDGLRASTYGLPGMFRPKSYGVEYRTLSNFWLTKPEYTRFVYKQTVKAFENFVHKDKDISKGKSHLARSILGGHKVRDALSLLKRSRVLVSKKQWTDMFEDMAMSSKYQFMSSPWFERDFLPNNFWLSGVTDET